MWELAFAVLLFTALSGLMAAIEASVLTVTHGEVQELVTEGVWGAGALKFIRQKMTQAMGVLVVATNTINILGPILIGRRAIQLYGDVAIAGITMVLTLTTIVFSEILPKSLGSHYAPLISRCAAPVIRLLMWLLSPLVVPLEWLSSLLKTGERRIGTELQIRSLATIGRRRGYIGSAEGKLVRRTFLLNDRSASDIMTPLNDVVSVEDTTTVQQAAARVFRHAFSRYPVFQASTREVIGLVLSRDILQSMTEGNEQDPISTICRPILKVPVDMRSDRLLVRFRDARVHLAGLILASWELQDFGSRPRPCVAWVWPRILPALYLFIF